MSEKYVLFNGKLFAAFSESGKTITADKLKKAYVFSSPQSAREARRNAPVKLSYFYVHQVGSDGELYKVSKRRNKRKTYTREERIDIYNRYKGHCNLCGRKLDFSEMTLDHVIPLDKGGLDNMENLQCSCTMCNNIKMNILLQDFFERINSIYLYQTEKRFGQNTLRCKVIKYLSR